jgi:tellurite methyltransferase
MGDSKSKWNQKHEERLVDLRELPANERLIKVTSSLSGGKALDLACGLGGNSLYLAKKGFQLKAYDISDVAIQHLDKLAKKLQLPIDANISDLTNWKELDFVNQKFELVVMTYYLDRSLLPIVKSVVKEDGFCFMETYFSSLKKKERDISERFKLRPQELLNEFSDWQILYYEENEEEGKQTIFCRKR